MLSVNGYYKNGVCVPAETLELKNEQVKQNQKVIITFLDDFVPSRKKRTLAEIKSYMSSSTKSVPEGISTVDYVRGLRNEDE